MCSLVQIVKEQIFTPVLQELTENVDVSPTLRLINALSMCMLAKRMGFSTNQEEANKMISLFRLDIDEERRECPQVFAVLNHFDEMEHR